MQKMGGLNEESICDVFGMGSCVAVESIEKLSPLFPRSIFTIKVDSEILDKTLNQKFYPWPQFDSSIQVLLDR